MFRFQRSFNRTFDEAVFGIEDVFKWIEWNINEGPSFGRNELVFSLNTRQALTEKLIFYAEHMTDNETLLFEEYSTYLHDVEVLSIGGKSSVAKDVNTTKIRSKRRTIYCKINLGTRHYSR